MNNAPENATELLDIVDVWMIPSTAAVVNAWMADPRYRFGFENIFRGAVPPVKSIESSIEDMDAAGVSHALLSAMIDDKQEVASNSLIADCVQAHPDRFTGSCCLDPRGGAAGARELRRWVREYGFRSVKLLPWAFSLRPDAALWFPIYAEAEALGVPVTVQVGHTAPLFPSKVGYPMYLDEVALRFPELKLIAGHLGWPWTDEVIALATKFPNFYIDTSAHSPSAFPAALVKFMNTERGASKVMFGSDYPALSLKRLVDSAMKLPVSAPVLRAFLGGNARTVYGLEAMQGRPSHA